MTARGLRCANPLNLRKSTDQWQGLAEVQDDDEFFTFKSIPYGIRAAARVMLGYQDKRGLRTIEGIIQRWAPEHENQTWAYADNVATWTGFSKDQQLDLHNYNHLKPLVTAMIRMECGADHGISDAEIDKGLVLAGVEPDKPKSLVTNKTAQGSAINIGTGAIAATAATVGPLIPFFSDLADLIERHPRGVIAIFGLLVMIGGALSLWAKWRERQRGIA